MCEPSTAIATFAVPQLDANCWRIAITRSAVGGFEDMYIYGFEQVNNSVDELVEVLPDNRTADVPSVANRLHIALSLACEEV